MALVQLTHALKLVIVEKVNVHSGTTAALATRPLHERGLGKHERSIGTLKQTVAGVVKFPVLAATLPWSPGLVIAVIIRKLVLVVIIIGLRNHCATMMRNGSMLKRKNVAEEDDSLEELRYVLGDLLGRGGGRGGSRGVEQAKVTVISW